MARKEGNTLISRYDAEGLRYEIEENEKLSSFIYNKENTLVEVDKDENVVSRFTRGYEVVAADIDEERYYYSCDEQGSTIAISDKDEVIRNYYHYDGFGNILSAEENVHNRIKYTGQQFDITTNQYYLRARYYSPIIGRFTQEDVYRGDGLNLYAYCGNNPVEYCDFSGYARKAKPIIIEDNYLVSKTLERVTNGTNIIPTGEEFNKWFDKLTVTEITELYSHPATKNKIKDLLRGDGGMHEWFMVSKAPVFKSWGMTADDIMKAVTPTSEVNFYNILTKEGFSDGVHGIATATVSSNAHLQISNLIESSNSKEEFMKKLGDWAEEHYARSIVKDNLVEIRAGKKGLPEEFKDKTKKCMKK